MTLVGTRRALLYRDFLPSDFGGLQLWLESDRGVMGGNASQFTAANSESLSIADNASIQTGEIDFWVAGWIYGDSLLSGAGVVGKAIDVGPAGEFSVDINGSKFRFYTIKSNNAYDTVVTANTFGALSTGTWYFFMGYHDSVNGRNAICGNNAAFDTGATTGTISTAGLKDFRIGIWSAYWNGRMQCVAFGKNPVGGIAGLATTIRDYLYNGGTPRRYEEIDSASKTSWGLVSYYNLCEPSGTRSDSHGTNHLTDNNTVTGANGVALQPAVNNDPVRQWNDLSGNGNHATQSTSATRPKFLTAQLGAMPVVNFPGSRNLQLSSLQLFPGKRGSVYVVIDPTDPTANAMGGILATYGGSATHQWIYYMTGTGGSLYQLFYLSGRNLENTTSATPSVITLHRTSDTALAFWRDGVAKLTPAIADVEFDAAPAAIGARQSGAESMVGSIAAILVYSNTHGATERARVERYLGRKYGISVP